MAKLIGQLWNSLSADEKKIYQDKATAEREQVAKEMQAWKDAGGVVEEPTPATNTSNPNSLIFPAARIRKICKLDPEVKNLSKEALLLVCKAAELALSQLGRESVKVAQIQNRRKLVPDDVATVCNTREQFLFLREDIQDLARSTAAAQQQNAKGNSKPTKPIGKPQGRPITDFFAPKSSL
jgi:histone H3/H4